MSERSICLPREEITLKSLFSIICFLISIIRGANSVSMHGTTRLQTSVFIVVDLALIRNFNNPRDVCSDTSEGTGNIKLPHNRASVFTGCFTLLPELNGRTPIKTLRFWSFTVSYVLQSPSEIRHLHCLWFFFFVLEDGVKPACNIPGQKHYLTAFCLPEKRVCCTFCSPHRHGVNYGLCNF